MTIPRKQAPWILGNWSQDVLPRLIPAAGKETMDQGLAKISKDVNPHVRRPMLQRAQSAQTRVRSVSCPLARRVAGLDSTKKREDEDAASLRGGLYCNERWLRSKMSTTVIYPATPAARVRLPGKGTAAHIHRSVPWPARQRAPRQERVRGSARRACSVGAAAGVGVARVVHRRVGAPSSRMLQAAYIARSHSPATPSEVRLLFNT